MVKILIAEDEPDIRELIKFTLEFGGYEVVVTKNGQEAAELAPKIMPDIIMMDVRMPKMTGYQACAAIKANPKVKHIPVIFLSAKGQDQEVETGMSVGAVDYILKPFAPEELLYRLKEIQKQIKETASSPNASDSKEDSPKASDPKEGSPKKSDPKENSPKESSPKQAPPA